MKKGVIFALLAMSLPCWPDGWDLPVTTLRYEVDQGQIEDPDDETLEPSSMRHTVTLHVKEASDLLSLGLTLRAAAKDYYEQRGDWSYWQAEHEGAFHVTDALKLGYTLGVKDMSWADPSGDGSSKDALYVNAAATADLALVRGTSVDAMIGDRFTIAVDPTGSQQAFVVSAGLSSRLGDWRVGARCRARLRFPLGTEGDTSVVSLATAAISLQWDPN